MHYALVVTAVLQKVYTTLIIMSGLSQAVTTYGTGIQRPPATESNCTNNDEANFRADQLQVSCLAQDDAYTVKTEKVTSFIDGAKSGLHELSSLVEKDQEALKNFNVRFQRWVKGAKIFKSRAATNVTTCCVTNDQFNSSLSSLEKDLLSLEQSQSIEVEDTFIPAPSSSEVNCIQPYLMVLLRALGSAVDGVQGGQRKGSPSKTSISSNRVIPGNNLRPKRIVDQTISANGRFIFMFRDDAIEIAVEQKCFARDGSGPKALLDSAREQILSHCAKHVGVGFNFAGMGIDSRATGIIMNPACVLVL